MKASRLYKNKIKYLEGQVWSTALGDTIIFESILKGMCMNLTSQILNTLRHQIYHETTRLNWQSKSVRRGTHIYPSQLFIIKCYNKLFGKQIKNPS